MDAERSFQVHGYIGGESMAGYIFYRHGKQRFFPLWADGAEHPTFFPRHCTVCDSNAGLLLCHFPISLDQSENTALRPSSYFLCNPYLPDSARNIPNPPNGPHPDRIPRVLTVNSDQTLPRFVFHVVCALTICRSHTYTFDVYSSATNTWSNSGPHDVLGCIREETGVSCLESAFWLLKDRPSAISYNALDHRFGTIDLPDSYVALFRQPDVQFRSQLGRTGTKLCFVAAQEHWRALYSYDGEWHYDHARKYAYPQLPMLSRFEDGRVHVPFWFDSGVLVIWDGRWGSLKPDRVAYLRGPQRDLGTDVLPLVATRFHPLHHFGHSSCYDPKSGRPIPFLLYLNNFRHEHMKMNPGLNIGPDFKAAGELWRRQMGYADKTPYFEAAHNLKIGYDKAQQERHAEPEAKAKRKERPHLEEAYQLQYKAYLHSFQKTEAKNRAQNPQKRKRVNYVSSTSEEDSEVDLGPQEESDDSAIEDYSSTYESAPSDDSGG